jgi:hypothetical protein
LLKKRSPEQIAAMERQQVRLQELEVAQTEAAKVKSANDATVALMSQKHDSYRKAAEGLGKSFHSNPNVNPSDAQSALVALAKDFGIIASEPTKA